MSGPHSYFRAAAKIKRIAGGKHVVWPNLEATSPRHNLQIVFSVLFEGIRFRMWRSLKLNMHALLTQLQEHLAPAAIGQGRDKKNFLATCATCDDPVLGHDPKVTRCCNNISRTLWENRAKLSALFSPENSAVLNFVFFFWKCS